MTDSDKHTLKKGAKKKRQRTPTWSRWILYPTIWASGGTPENWRRTVISLETNRKWDRNRRQRVIGLWFQNPWYQCGEIKIRSRRTLHAHTCRLMCDAARARQNQRLCCFSSTRIHHHHGPIICSARVQRQHQSAAAAGTHRVFSGCCCRPRLWHTGPSRHSGTAGWALPGGGKEFGFALCLLCIRETAKQGNVKWKKSRIG